MYRMHTAIVSQARVDNPPRAPRDTTSGTVTAARTWWRSASEACEPWRVEVVVGAEVSSSSATPADTTCRQRPATILVPAADTSCHLLPATIRGSALSCSYCSVLHLASGLPATASRAVGGAGADTPGLGHSR